MTTGRHGPARHDEHAAQIRIDGEVPAADAGPLRAGDEDARLFRADRAAEAPRFEENLEIDFSFGVKGLARFRANVYNQRGAPRLIPWEIKSFRDMGLPEVVAESADRPRGLVLVRPGPTGSGKSTTLAAMIDKINAERSEHIVTNRGSRSTTSTSTSGASSTSASSAYTHSSATPCAGPAPGARMSC